MYKQSLHFMYIMYCKCRHFWNIFCIDKFDKFIFIISKMSQTHEENTCRIVLYKLWLKKKLHTCIIPCNTTLVWHVDKISTKYTHIIMDTVITWLDNSAVSHCIQRHMPIGPGVLESCFGVRCIWSVQLIFLRYIYPTYYSQRRVRR